MALCSLKDLSLFQSGAHLPREWYRLEEEGIQCWLNCLITTGERQAYKGRFPWYTYMPSSLELNIHHYYLFPRYLSDLYSKGQKLVPNIMGSKCPHNPWTLLPISCLIEKAMLFFPWLSESLLISRHFFHTITSWVLQGLALRAENAPLPLWQARCCEFYWCGSGEWFHGLPACFPL